MSVYEYFRISLAFTPVLIVLSQYLSSFLLLKQSADLFFTVVSLYVVFYAKSPVHRNTSAASVTVSGDDRVPLSPSFTHMRLLSIISSKARK